MSSYPSLDDLIWLFEIDPHIEFEDLGWPQSSATFDSVRGDWRIKVTLDVYAQDLQLTVWHLESMVIDLRFRWIVDLISVDRTAGREALNISFTAASAMKPARLELKPRISLAAANRLHWEVGR